MDIPSTQDHEVLRELCEQYSEYIKINTDKQKESIEDVIEEMLTRLDEFCGILDLARSYTTLSVTRTLPEIHERCTQMEAMYEKIDQLEMFMELVKDNLNTMERKVVKAEQDLATDGTFKKMFSSIYKPSIRPTSDPAIKVEYQAPDIFVTEEIFGLQTTKSSETLS